MGGTGRGTGNHRHTRAASGVAALALTALLGLLGCGGGSPQVDLADLTTSYDCGYGFQAGNGRGTVGIFIVDGDYPDRLPTGRFDLADDPSWSGVIEAGSHLFIDWCDDVGEAGEPSPEVQQTWELVEGVIEVRTESGDATMSATDLVAVDPDGVRHELGDIILVNSAWGVVAG